jgi:hypothetical protein
VVAMRPAVERRRYTPDILSPEGPCVDLINYQPRMLPLVRDSGVLADDPFVLVDVGCAMGLAPYWRLFEPYLHALGIDPQDGEAARLDALEQNPHVQYRQAFVSLPEDHPVMAERAVEVGNGLYHRNPFERSSAMAAYSRVVRDKAREEDNARGATETWTEQIRAETPRLTLEQLVAEAGLTTVDFIKTDTDGSDFDAVVSAGDLWRTHTVLGAQIEVDLHGPPPLCFNSFHAVHGHMMRLGYFLFSLQTYPYTRAALPGLFAQLAPYQTVDGQPMAGDASYFRDAAAINYDHVWKAPLSLTKILKLACLFELNRLPDCAAELIVTYRDQIAERLDPTPLLDALTPPLPDGRQVSYADYVQEFERDYRAFFPRA